MVDYIAYLCLPDTISKTLLQPKYKSIVDYIAYLFLPSTNFKNKIGLYGFRVVQYQNTGIKVFNNPNTQIWWE